MENYKNSKIGQETAQKYGDIIEMERPQTEESLRKHPRMTLQNRARRILQGEKKTICGKFSSSRNLHRNLLAQSKRKTATGFWSRSNWAVRGIEPMQLSIRRGWI